MNVIKHLCKHWEDKSLESITFNNNFPLEKEKPTGLPGQYFARNIAPNCYLRFYKRKGAFLCYIL